jgi:hypothetical protein
MIIDNKDGVKKIDSILERLIQERGLDPKLLEQKALAGWKDAVGALIARYTRPVSLVDGRLTVYASNSVWVTELSLLKPQVISKINAAVGQQVVKDWRIVVKPFERSNDEEIQRPQRPSRLKLERDAPAPEVVERVEQTVADVADEELKACLRRLFITQSQYAETEE